MTSDHARPLRLVLAGDRRLWRCRGCDRVDVWSDAWSWWGSMRDLDERPEKLVVVCSQRCRDLCRAFLL